MNYIIKIPFIIAAILFPIIIFHSCETATIAEVTTGTVSDILQNSAYSGGHVTRDGGARVTARGVCWNTAADPTVTNNKTSDSSGVGLFTSQITGLTPNTLYYVRAYATNSEGTAYGDQVTFTTATEAIPTVITSGVKSVTSTTAISGGVVSNEGGIPVTARGICWNTTGVPTIADSHTSDGTGKGQFTSTLSDLTVNTTFFIRSYATNNLGTGYGDEVEFIQMEPVTDSDGNVYSVVTLGTQIWLGENLKTTKLNDGTDIQNISAGMDWAYASSAAYCWYDNNASEYKSTYGAIYNWLAVNTGKLCPAGWHVPTSEEFETMVTYLGGDMVAGGKLKEAGTVHWKTPNLGATNSSGFTALPAGGRYNTYSAAGVFTDLNYYTYMWSATSSMSNANAYSYDMAYNMNIVNKGEYSKTDGESVRCIMDSE